MESPPASTSSAVDNNALVCPNVSTEPTSTTASEKSVAGTAASVWFSQLNAAMLEGKARKARRRKEAMMNRLMHTKQRRMEQMREFPTSVEASDEVINLDKLDEAAANRLRMGLRERPRVDRKLRANELKFLEDFDPEKSNRERRKLKRKIGGVAKNSPYDEYGHMRHNELDVCDCLSSMDCPGCWYTCENCGSRKCGVQCRVNRKFYYESICFDGKETIIRNPYFPTK